LLIVKNNKLTLESVISVILVLLAYFLARSITCDYFKDNTEEKTFFIVLHEPEALT